MILALLPATKACPMLVTNLSTVFNNNTIQLNFTKITL